MVSTPLKRALAPSTSLPNVNGTRSSVPGQHCNHTCPMSNTPAQVRPLSSHAHGHGHEQARECMRMRTRASTCTFARTPPRSPARPRTSPHAPARTNASARAFRARAHGRTRARTQSHSRMHNRLSVLDATQLLSAKMHAAERALRAARTF